MNGLLWIALGATLLVVAAHLALAWLFLRKPRDPKPDPRDPGEP